MHKYVYIEREELKLCVTSSPFDFLGVATRWCCDTIVTSVLLWGSEQLGPILRGCQDGWGPLGDYDGQGGG